MLVATYHSQPHKYPGCVGFTAKFMLELGSPLLGREVGGEQQLRDGDHAVQGRAYLVAHICQEHALRLGCRLCRHLRILRVWSGYMHALQIPSLSTQKNPSRQLPAHCLHPLLHSAGSGRQSLNIDKLSSTCPWLCDSDTDAVWMRQWTSNAPS